MQSPGRWLTADALTLRGLKSALTTDTYHNGLKLIKNLVSYHQWWPQMVGHQITSTFHTGLPLTCLNNDSGVKCHHENDRWCWYHDLQSSPSPPPPPPPPPVFREHFEVYHSKLVGRKVGSQLNPALGSPRQFCPGLFRAACGIELL